MCRRLFVAVNLFHANQNGVGLLASSQEQGAAELPRMKPLVNRLATGSQPVTVFLDSAYIGFNVFALPKKRPGRFGFLSGWRKRKFMPWAQGSAQLASRHVLSRPAQPSLAPPRLALLQAARGMFGFWIRPVQFTPAGFLGFQNRRMICCSGATWGGSLDI